MPTAAPVRPYEYATIAALLLGPLVATLIALWLSHRHDRARENRERDADLAREERDVARQRAERRRAVFRVLMTTRQTSIAFDRVRALNSIDVEFYDERPVRDAWKGYADHLNNFPQPVPPATEATPDAIRAWAEKGEEIFFDLLLKMAKATGYDLNATDIRRVSYRPKGHGDIETMQQAALRGAAEVFAGGKPLMIALAPTPQAPQAPDTEAPALPRPANS
jgi:hypothetical protein